MPYYLILEDDDAYFEQVYQTAYRDRKGTDDEFTFYRAKTVAEAHGELEKSRFSGAILDLHLAGGKAEGNEVAKKIHSAYLMPVAVVTGFQNELEPELKDLANKVGFFRSFNKSGKNTEVFDFLSTGTKSGVLEMLAPGGEFTKMISEIFWNHLGEVIKNWHGKTMDTQDKRRVLRHAVSHMIGALLSKEDGNWDKFLSEEIYIWPAICNKEIPGHIYEGTPIDGAEKGFFLLVTPICDIEKSDMEFRHFIRILPFSTYEKYSDVKDKVSKKEYRYHVLPPTSFFRGGVADFATLLTVPKEKISTEFKCKGSLIEPYWRELVNRLGAWLGRQGTPVVDGGPLKSEIEKLLKPIQTASPTV
jgi:ActR/RegA family two-component response regulator